MSGSESPLGMALLARLLPVVPRAFVWQLARRYIAGESYDAMLATVRRLNAAGAACTIDYMGEFVTNIPAAEQTALHYQKTLTCLHEAGLHSGLSIKLTALGLLLNRDTCARLLRDILSLAQRYKQFVRIDMEDTRCTADTIELYLRFRREFENVGIVLQASLRRSLGDARLLSQHQAADIRLCKGAYLEPREMAYTQKILIDKNYVLLLEELFQSGAKVAIATHDEHIIWQACRLIDRYKVRREQFEFQMLLGVDPQLQQILTDSGHRVRVYVPFGPQWHGYCMRRLRENPKLIGYTLSNLFKK